MAKESPRTDQALTSEEFEAFIRNGTPADWVMVCRLKVTVQCLLQVERACALLCKKNPGIYDHIELALGNLEAKRQS